jgi:hypothetical protein
MIKIKISNVGVSELLEIRDDILKLGLVQGPDFSFSYHPKAWDDFTGDIPSWAEFKFEDEKRCTLFLLKNSNRASVIS